MMKLSRIEIEVGEESPSFFSFFSVVYVLPRVASASIGPVLDGEIKRFLPGDMYGEEAPNPPIVLLFIGLPPLFVLVGESA